MFVVKYVYVHKQRYGKVYNKNFTWQSVGLYVSSKLYKVNIYCLWNNTISGFRDFFPQFILRTLDNINKSLIVQKKKNMIQ